MGLSSRLTSPTGGWGFVMDINNDGLILAEFDADPTRGFDGGPGEPANQGISFIIDDNMASRIALPETIDGLPAGFEIKGMNNEGQLAGGTWD